MNNHTAALKDGQALARRIGALIAIIVICIGCTWLGATDHYFLRPLLGQGRENL